MLDLHGASPAPSAADALEKKYSSFWIPVASESLSVFLFGILNKEYLLLFAHKNHTCAEENQGTSFKAFPFNCLSLNTKLPQVAYQGTSFKAFPFNCLSLNTKLPQVAYAFPSSVLQQNVSTKKGGLTYSEGVSLRVSRQFQACCIWKESTSALFLYFKKKKKKKKKNGSGGGGSGHPGTPP